MNVSTETLQRISKALSKATTSGIDTGTGLNYYYLEPWAKNLYPVFYPLLASTPRSVPMFGGQRVGGTTVNWKAITGIGNGYYIGLDEGKRNSALPITTQDYAAPFRYFGVDIPVTFQAEMSGLGFEDNLGMLRKVPQRIRPPFRRSLTPQ